MWPLDASAVVLGGLVLLLIVTQLRFDDPRWLFNAKTYLIAVPAISLLLALALRTLASRFLRKSIQLSFLFSVCVHLLLLIFAINYVVFSAYQPTASKGQQRERTPIRKTVPEHLFQAPKESKETPDWSKPVDAETTSRVIPKEQRQLPPLQRSQPRLEIPKPRQNDVQPMQKYLMQRAQPSSTVPMPADSPGRLARRDSQRDAIKPRPKPIDVPSIAQSIASPTKASPAERPIENAVASRAARQAPSRPDPAAVARNLIPVPSSRNLAPAAAARSPQNALPKVGDAGLARDRRSRSTSPSMTAAGAAPAPVAVSVARSGENASMLLRPNDLPVTRSGQTTGAQISDGDTPSFRADPSADDPATGTRIARKTLSAKSGAPEVDAGPADLAAGRGERINVATGFEPVGSVAPSASLPPIAAGISGQSMEDDPLDDRMGDLDSLADRQIDSGGIPSRDLLSSGAPAMALDLLADPGPVGLGKTPAPAAGLMPSEDRPEIATMDLPRQARPRLQVGGPATPAGTKIAAVESFSRRVMRTSGGAASNAPGLGGPATEEAIERGLAYLAAAQNDDGSWSLQGHGEDVLLRSDTAATGLCLLAFQGAGYTHTQHQYASTVSKGLKFLIDNQRTSGNLYRSENSVSDRNVMFYSHGIAALALCEAYGMTQDRELRPPAQQALGYIVQTQHHKRGGWRYTPQVSSDTSVTGWMMMALKSGELSGLDVPQETYDGIDHWLSLARQSPERIDRYRYNPFAPDTPEQRHGRVPTPTMTAVGMLMRMYNGWRRDHPAMRSAAEYLLKYPPQLGDPRRPRRDGYYWYYATQVMFHMGDEYWDQWNRHLNPLLLETQIKSGPDAGSWDPENPVPDRWSVHAGRLYVTTMNLLNLEVYYRHLPIYEDTAAD
ncbi:hypothetical protein FYK55_08700 [Roseiconus nitratireducens]|uniref:Uncharacterized protein n=2 Tax=Roseiconus nitratireducens TaxID=2605748 RepID=A0A5M6DAT8_9BACT|nr:hypothetical protein FYK55_08700 [Roseiconus nitratireducens]